MGLLDFLNSDDGAQLGMQMLAAGGPSSTPMSFGQRANAAVTAANASKTAQTDAALKKAQLDEAVQKTAVEKFGLQRLQDWQKLTMGDGSAGATAQPTAMAPSMSPTQTAPVDTSGGLIGSLQGNAPPQGAQPSPPQQSQPAPGMVAPQSAGPSAFRFGLPGISDGNSRAIAASMPPADYMKLYAEKGGPQTDIGKLMIQAGIDPNSVLGKQMTQQAIAKSNHIAPTTGRGGGYVINPDGTMEQLPAVPEGSTASKGPDGQWNISPVAGGLAGVTAVEAAKKLGANQQTPTVGYDPVTGKPIYRTAAQNIDSANGVPPPQQPLPAPEGGLTGNFVGMHGAIMSQIAGMKTPQERANAASAYANQLATLGQPKTAAPSASGYPTTAIPEVLPQQMPGLVSNANAANEASAKTMHDSYARLQAGAGGANSALESITKMQQLAANRVPYVQSGPMNMSILGSAQTALSDGAAEYEKHRANVIPMLAGLSGVNRTDSGTALIGDSVPGFNKPQGAIKDGLSTLSNQIKSQQLKGQFLTPFFQSGDSKTYTQKENEYDKNIAPSMMQIMSMPPGASRSMLLESAVKDPVMRDKFAWAMQNGMLAK